MKFRRLILWLFVLIAPSFAWTQTWYVSLLGDGSDGLSPETAYSGLFYLFQEQTISPNDTIVLCEGGGMNASESGIYYPDVEIAEFFDLYRNDTSISFAALQGSKDTLLYLAFSHMSIGSLENYKGSICLTAYGQLTIGGQSTTGAAALSMLDIENYSTFKVIPGTTCHVKKLMWGLGDISNGITVDSAEWIVNGGDNVLYVNPGNGPLTITGDFKICGPTERSGRICLEEGTDASNLEGKYLIKWANPPNIVSYAEDETEYKLVDMLELDDALKAYGITEVEDGLILGEPTNDSPLADGGPYTETVDGIEWTFYVEGGKAKIGAKQARKSAISAETSGAIVIPATLGGCPVSCVGEYAFYVCKGITSITLPDGVVEIGSYAFVGCESIAVLSVSNKVTQIGDGAFLSCPKLENIVVDDDNPNYKSINGVLYDKGVTTIISCPAGKTAILIPATITTIDYNAFYSATKLSVIEVATDNAKYIAVDNVIYNKDKTELILCAPTKTTLDIPTSVRKIGNAACDRCEVLEHVSIPNGVTTICSSAFRWCYKLAEITIPDSVTRIENDAFYGSGLTSINIPVSVTYVGDYAFQSCKSLTDVELSPNIEIIEKQLFDNCISLNAVVIPEGIKSIGFASFNVCKSLESITIPKSVETIALYAFEGCISLKTVYVSVNDADRVKELMRGKGIDVDTLEFVELQAESSNKKQLLYYYPLDGNCDNLGSASDDGFLVLNGTPVFVENAKFGRYSLKSGNSNVSSDHAGSYTLTNEKDGLAKCDEDGWTLTFWFCSNEVYNWRDVCGFNIGEVAFKFEKTQYNALQMYNNAQLGDLKVPIAYTPNTWMNIAVVCQGSNGFTLYANGEKVQDFNLNEDLASSPLTRLVMGANNLVDARASTALTSNYAIYSFALDEDQLAALTQREPFDFYGEDSDKVRYTVPEGVTKTVNLEITGDIPVYKEGQGTLIISGVAEGYTGRIYIKEGTLDIEHNRNLQNVEFLEGSKLAVKEVFADDGHLRVTGIVGNPVVEIYTPNGTLINGDDIVIESDNGVLDAYFTPTVDGQACWLAYEMNGSLENSGYEGTSLTRDSDYGYGVPYFYGTDPTGDFAQNADGEYYALYAGSHPYRHLSTDYPENWTCMVSCTLPQLDRAAVVMFGALYRSNSNGGTGILGLITGSVEENTVLLVRTPNAHTHYEVMAEMKVPNAFTTPHMYLFVKQGRTVNIYVDGSFWSTYTFREGDDVSLGRGMQIASVHGGIEGTGVVRFTPGELPDRMNDPRAYACIVDSMRFYDCAIGEKSIETLKNEFPYVPENGKFTRTIEAETALWNETSAWLESATLTRTDTPEVNSDVALKIDNATELIVNTSSTSVYESLTFSGSGSLSVVNGAGEVVNGGQTTIGLPLTIEYGAMSISGGPTKLLSRGSLHFDFSNYPIADVMSDKFVQLTGIIEEADAGRVTCTLPDYLYGRTMNFVYDNASKTYRIEIGLTENATVAVLKTIEFEGDYDNNLSPGDQVTVHATVINLGGVPTSSLWSIDLYLRDDAQETKIGTYISDQPLMPNESRDIVIAATLHEIIPVSGQVSFRLNGYESEPVLLNKRIYLSAAADSVRENYSSGIRYTLRRSGNIANAQEYAISAVGATDKARIPTSVIIADGNRSATFTVTPINDNVVTGDREIKLTINGDGCEARHTLTILEDEIPSLMITLSAGTIREGDAALIGTVTRDYVTDEPLVVYLSGASTSQLKYPSSVTIPAGEASVQFEILAIDNTTAEITANVTLQASAAGYASATRELEVEDDDVPNVSFTLSPEVVSEGAGTRAVYATLMRSDLTNITAPITVRLSADVANQLILPSEIVIPSNTQSVGFYIGIVDDLIDQDNREVTIDGAILIPDCGCSAQPSYGDKIQAKLTILDDDIPSLSLKVYPPTWREGVKSAGELTISHNSSTTEDLTVALSVDIAGELALPKEVVIPAGKNSVTINVDTLDDGVTDGNRRVSIYATDTHEIFNSASTWVIVTDTNLPDLHVEDIEVTGSFIAGQPLLVSAAIVNSGFTDVSEPIVGEIYFVRGSQGDSIEGEEIAKSFILHDHIDVNAALQVIQSVEAPMIPGEYHIVVRLDPSNIIAEIDEVNNKSSGNPFEVSSSYNATAKTDKAYYSQGETVVISGRVLKAGTNQPAIEAELQVRLTVKGYNRYIAARTDVNGDYCVEFTPQSNEYGHYAIAVGYPGFVEEETVGEFDILSFEVISNASPTIELVQGVCGKVMCELRNPTSIKQTGIKLEIIEQPDNCVVEFNDIADSLDPDAVVVVEACLTGIALSPAWDWQSIKLRLSSNEGSVYDMVIRYHVRAQGAKLQITPNQVDMNVTIGENRSLIFELSNVGQGDAENVRFKMPDLSWMKLVSENEFTRLKAGESVKAMVSLDPPENVFLNTAYSGTFVVTADNAPEDVSVAFKFVPVTDRVGSVRFSIADIQTTAEGALLKGAEITVVNTGNATVVAKGVSDDNGEWLMSDIPAGTYRVTVSAANHATKQFIIEVSPGAVLKHAVYLDYSAVTYSWNAVKTEVEDVYTMELLAEYETNVPVPILRIKSPESIPEIPQGSEYVAGFTVYNDGLINLLDVKLCFDGDLPYSFEQLTPNIPILAPHTSEVIYVKFVNPAQTSRMKLANGGFNEAFPCTGGYYAEAKMLCGAKAEEVLSNKDNLKLTGVFCDLAKHLFDNIGFNPFSGGGRVEGPSGPGKSEIQPTTKVPGQSTRSFDCECYYNALDNMLGVFVDKVPGSGLVKSGLAFQKAKKPSDYVKAALGAASMSVGEFVSFYKSTGKLPESVSDKLDGVITDLEVVVDSYEGCISSLGKSEFGEALSKGNKLLKGSRNIINIGKLTKSLKSLLTPSGSPRSTKDDIICAWIIKRWESGFVPSREDWSEFNTFVLNNFNMVSDQARFCETIDRSLKLMNELMDEDKKDEPTRMTRMSLAASNESMDAKATIRELKSLIDEILAEEHVETLDEYIDKISEEINQLLDGGEALSVCTRVTLSFKQTMVMTREAIEGTLELSAGEGRGNLSNVHLELSVVDSDGVECVDRFFGSRLADSSNFGEGSILEGTANLTSGNTGTASIIFVPTPEAAPTTSKLYYFGGYLSFHDEETGEDFRAKLTPVALLVNPSCYLQLDYFMQRDVVADNPFTKDLIEPSEPAELALLVRNIGAGTAKNVTIASAQPQIIKNDSGLEINFSLTNCQLKSSAVNGEEAHLLLKDVELGNIEPGDSKVAQWWLESTLEGHFEGLSATVTQLDLYNNPSTSLVDPKVGVHHLVKSFDADNDGKSDFLTCDGDLFGRPKEIYLADGRTIAVEAASEVEAADLGMLRGARATVQVTVNGCAGEWTYAYISQPGLYRYTVARIVDSLGKEIDPNRAWITDRVFRELGLPLREERLHIVDSFEIGQDSKTYSLELVAKPSDPLKVELFTEIIDGQLLLEPMKSLRVKFTQPFDPDSVDGRAVELMLEGNVVDLSTARITQDSDDASVLVISGIENVCNNSGKYSLTVRPFCLTNLCGVAGVEEEDSISWFSSLPEAPIVVSCEGVSPFVRETIDMITIGFSKSIDLATFVPNVVSVNDLTSNEVTISPLNEENTVFAISGLSALQSADGKYTLAIDLRRITSTDGVAGSYVDSRSWVIDRVPPEIIKVEREEVPGALRMVVHFSKNVEGYESALVVKVNDKTVEAEVRAKGSVVTIVVSAALFQTDGSYELCLDTSAVCDAAGNLCLNKIHSFTLSVDNTPPTPVAGLCISPDTGIEGDSITSEHDLIVSGYTEEQGLDVELFCRYYDGTVVELGSVEIQENLTFAKKVCIEGNGQASIVAISTDKAGNTSEASLDIRIDDTPLLLSLTLGGDPTNPIESIYIDFAEEPQDDSVINAPFSLTCNGKEIDASEVYIEKLSSLRYAIYGLAGKTDECGAYRLRLDANEICKRISGLKAGRQIEVDWAYVYVDNIAPIITAVRFDEKRPASAYADHEMFSTVTITFSEPISVSELIDSGMAGVAFRVEVLDDSTNIVGTIDSENFEWNEQENTASWSFDSSRVPCGNARVVVDASLVHDLSGNALALSDATDVSSGFHTFEPSLLLAEAAFSYACPTLIDWDGDGLLDLLVGEKTADEKGRVRMYINRGSATRPLYDDFFYLKSGEEIIEFPAEGCVGLQCSFGTMRRSMMALATAQGLIYGWNYRYKDPETQESAEMELLFDSTIDSRFSSLIRAQTFCHDIDGDGKDEILVSGQNSPMFTLKIMDDEEVKCTPVLNVSGGTIVQPEGQKHFSAVLTDINGDTIPDLVTGDTDGNVWTYLGTRDGRYADEPTLLYRNSETSNSRSRLAVGDIDGDGIQDLLVGRKDGSVLKLKGVASLTPAVNFRRVREKTLEEALSTEVYWYDFDEKWQREQSGEDARAVVTHESNGEETEIKADFVGAGELSFRWAVEGGFTGSSLACFIDESCRIRLTETTSLHESVLSIDDVGRHNVKWKFVGRGTATLCDIRFVPRDDSSQYTSESESRLPIAYADIRKFANGMWKECHGDYEEVVKMTAANGMSVYDCCVAGLDCEDEDAKFVATIEIVDGIPVVNPEPNLGSARSYTFYGCKALDSGWEIITPLNAEEMMFFKVDVDLK